MQNKGKVNIEPFLRLTELLAPWCCIQHCQTAPQNPEKLHEMRTRGNARTDPANLTGKIAYLGAWEKPTGAEGITRESHVKPMVLLRGTLVPCSVSNGEVGRAAEPDRQKTITRHLQGCFWRCTPWGQARVGVGPRRRWEHGDGGGSRTAAAPAQTDGICTHGEQEARGWSCIPSSRNELPWAPR